MPGEESRSFRLARVAGGLAAAGLPGRELHGAPRGFEQPDRADAHFGGDLIDHAGDEQGDGGHHGRA